MQNTATIFSIQPLPGSGETNLITQKSSRSGKSSPQFRGAGGKSSVSHSEPFNPPLGGFQVDCAVSTKVCEPSQLISHIGQ